VRDKEPDLEKAGPRVAELLDALACSQFSLLVLTGNLVRPTTLTERRFQLAHLGAEPTES
jgi:hypothetical protein